MKVKGTAFLNTNIKAVPAACNDPLPYMRVGHTTAAVLQYVELYSLLVLSPGYRTCMQKGEFVCVPRARRSPVL